jgi:hypothetical protein
MFLKPNIFTKRKEAVVNHLIKVAGLLLFQCKSKDFGELSDAVMVWG